MTGFFPLLRLQLLSRFADFKPKNLKAQMKEKKGRTIGMLIAIAFLIIYLGVIMVIVEKAVLDALMDMPAPLPAMPELLVTMAVVLTTAGTLIMAFFFIMSSLYLGRDTAYIASLPVKTRTVLSAKLVQVWVSETCIDAVVLLPACIQYGIRVGADAGFYLRMVIVWLLAAMLPIAIVSFVSALLIRISALWKHREIMTTVFGITFFVLYMILMMNVGQITGGNQESTNLIVNFFQSRHERIRSLSGIFPPAGWAADSMVNGDWKLLGLYALASIGSMALAIWLLGYVYRNLSLLQTETPAGKSRKGGVRAGDFRNGSALNACMKREFLQILRVPSYATNILPIAIMPLLMTLMMYFMVGKNIGDNGESIQMVLGAIPNHAIIMGILAAVMAYMAGMSPALSTSVSREGKGHDMLRSLPIDAQTLVRAKFIVGYGLAVFGVAAATIALIVIFPKLMTEAILALILCLLFCYITSALALMRDVKNPRLDWVTEQEAVKQNYGVLIVMLISWGMLAALGLLAFAMIHFLGWGLWPVFAVLAAILGGLSVLVHGKLINTVEKFYFCG